MCLYDSNEDINIIHTTLKFYLRFWWLPIVELSHIRNFYSIYNFFFLWNWLNWFRNLSFLFFFDFDISCLVFQVILQRAIWHGIKTIIKVFLVCAIIKYKIRFFFSFTAKCIRWQFGFLVDSFEEQFFLFRCIKYLDSVLENPNIIILIK